MKYYIHYAPGRIRIQTPLIHDNSPKGEEFKMFMKGFKGISEVEIHTVTGSAVIHFDEKVINCEQIIGIIEKHNYFRLAEAETCDEVIDKTTKKVVEVAEKIIIDSLEGGVGA